MDLINTQTELKKYLEYKPTTTDESKLKKLLLKNNVLFTFYNEIKNAIVEIWNKYQNKQLGEKTKQKIFNEIKNHFNNKINLWFSGDELNIYLIDHNQIEIKIYLQYLNEFVTNTNTINQININDLKVYNDYIYIDDIEKTTTELINIYNKAKKIQDEIHELNNKFNKLVSYQIEPIEYTYFVKSWII